jgi:hypothetical protein
MIKPGDPATARPLVDAVPATARARRRVALLVDPRFPGGTGSAVAAEIRALAPRVNLAVFHLATAMFPGREVNPAIRRVLEELSLPLLPQPPVVHADTIVLHNPTCLRFDTALGPRLSAARVIVVAHENFLRPGGCEGFDVGHCLGLVAGRVAGGERLLAPISATNRASVAAWLGRHPDLGWRLAPDDWPNICDQPFLAPTPTPRDRRGRHSRAGLEKFPPLAALRAQFSPQAERCAILGADTLLLDRESMPPHWQLMRFGAMPVPDFLASIDFFVYFTHPLLREGYGRAIAEAIAAGKLVITDEETAGPFGPGVVTDTGTGDGIDRIIASHVADPSRYAAAVLRTQADLAAYRPDPVAARLAALLEPEAPLHAVV